jgi:transcriptional regulator GlxA family with amidase domain
VRYLQRVRVEAAKRLLERTAETFEQITFRVCYEDPASFRRVFQTQTGLTPNTYRQRSASPLSIAG